MKKTSLFSCFLFVIILFIWEEMARGISELVLPAPSTIITTLYDGLKSGYYMPHIIHTSLEIGIGLLIGSILGIIIGVWMGEAAIVRKILSPYVIASQAVPKLALAPLFILWFGFGIQSKIVITALICFFPLMENTVTAIQYTDSQKIELFRVLGASRWQMLFHLKIPSGLPSIMAGFRVAAILAVVGAVVGEFIGGSEGLGAMIIASQGMMDTPMMFSILILVTMLGIIIYQFVYLIEKRLFRYKRDHHKRK
ncbi:ABC transporter permease [Cytobacillus sp. Hz8]|uniref:ABC transporter permease n=1 Tax=Cytobacillus sp. Hz8 TaxID=3347168 RepID=UPI0035D9F951